MWNKAYAFNTLLVGPLRNSPPHPLYLKYSFLNEVSHQLVQLETFLKSPPSVMRTF